MQNITQKYFLQVTKSKKFNKKHSTNTFYVTGPCLTDGGRGRRIGQDWSCMGDYRNGDGDHHHDSDFSYDNCRSSSLILMMIA